MIGNSSNFVIRKYSVKHFYNGNKSPVSSCEPASYLFLVTSLLHLPGNQPPSFLEGVYNFTPLFFSDLSSIIFLRNSLFVGPRCQFTSLPWEPVSHLFHWTSPPGKKDSSRSYRRHVSSPFLGTCVPYLPLDQIPYSF